MVMKSTDGPRKKQARKVSAFCDKNKGRVFTRSELIKEFGYFPTTYLKDTVLWHRLELVPNPRYSKYKIV